MIGEIENCIRDFEGFYHLTVKTKDPEAGRVYNELRAGEVDIAVTKPHKKRSLDANAYMWVLCGKLADKLSDEGTITTKEEVYRKAIKDVGVFKDVPMFAEGAETLQKAWTMHGIGWFTEVVDYLVGNIGYLVRCYYGSSCYNTKQLSRVISDLVQDCDALGVEHRTPEEIANMLSLWEQERKRNAG